MAVSLQVIYPISDSSTFDHAYYADTHMKLVAEHMGSTSSRCSTPRVLPVAQQSPPHIHAVATMIFADQAAMAAAIKRSGPVMEDVANFTNLQPQVLIGEVIS